MQSLSNRWRNFWRLFVSWFFIPTIAILAAVAVLTYFSYMRVTNEMIIDRDREVNSVAAARLRDELSQYAETLVSLSRTEDMYSGNVQRQQEGLKKARLRLTVFDGGVILLNNFGKIVAAEPERGEIIGQDWSSRDYFRHMLASKSIVFSNALNDGPQASKVVVVAVPVTGPDGDFMGALAGLFRLGSPTLSSFYGSIVRLRIGQTGMTYLVDGQGKIIYHPDLYRTGDNISDNWMVKNALSGESGAVRTTGSRGLDVVAAYSPVPGTPWALLSEEDWGVVTASSRQYGQLLLVLLGLGMVLPALGVALQIRQRNRETLARERIEQELRVARIIQKTLLPRELPVLPGWEIAVHWQPARAVGGDFYDFICFPDEHIGVMIADVTDKGIPAALVMASTRSILRGVSERMRGPGEILARMNNLLANDIPHNMFVTGFYADLDPASGKLKFANAGQNLPYRKCRQRVTQLEATGMPLGLMPGMDYDEYETVIEPGEYFILYSDGLVEAHNPKQEMVGNRRLEDLLQKAALTDRPSEEIIERILESLHQFTGPEWQQEDDVTLLVLRRLPIEGEGDTGHGNDNTD